MTSETQYLYGMDIITIGSDSLPVKEVVIEKQGENRYMATWAYRKRRRLERTGSAKPWETRRRRRE